MATDWNRLVREKSVAILPDAETDDGSALSCALSLIRAGFGLVEKSGRLSVAHPEGLRLSDEQRQSVAKHRDLILVLIRSFPPPEGDLLGWPALWRVELDSIRRVAASAATQGARDAALALANDLAAADEDSLGEEQWKSLCARVVALVGQLEDWRDFPQPEKLTPWRGWVREGGKGEDWKPTEVLESSWDQAWALLLLVEVDARSVERLCCPEGKHPDKRRKPR